MKLSVREFVVAAALLLAAILAVIPRAFAEDDAVALGVGTASRLFLEKTYQTVLISNPLVVDVRADDDRSVLIEPLGPGETNLVFIDASGIVIANVKISVCGMPPSKGCTAGRAS